MICTTRTLTCNFCGVWIAIDDTETAREARTRARVRGWRVLPNADQGGRLMDACPRRDEHHPASSVSVPDTDGMPDQTEEG